MMRAPAANPLLLALLMAGLAPVAVHAADQAPAANTPAVKQIADVTRGLQPQPGFIDVWRDTDKGRVLLAVGALEQPFLLVSSLPYALGSNDVDWTARSRAKCAWCISRSTVPPVPRAGKHQLRRQLGRPRRTCRRARVVLQFGAVVGRDHLASDKDRHLVDFSSFLLADRHGIAARLAMAKQGAYAVDLSRSAVLAAEAKAFPDNVELEALLTFAGPGQAEYVRQVGADRPACRCASVSAWCACLKPALAAHGVRAPTIHIRAASIPATSTSPRRLPAASTCTGKCATSWKRPIHRPPSAR
jgi:hypothetical protein